MDSVSYSLLSIILTLLVKWLIDLLTDTVREKRERRKMVFQKKTEAAERAMGCFVELYSNLFMLKESLSRITVDPSPAIVELLNRAIADNQRINSHLAEKMNAIYLYYDFSDIDEKYMINRINDTIYSLMDVISKTQKDIFEARQNGVSEDHLTPTLQLLTQEYKAYADAIECVLKSILAIQDRLRTDYRV